MMNLLLAAALHASAAQAIPDYRAALDAVAANLEANLETLDSLPVEFARAAAVLPYGNEPLPPLPAVPTPEDLIARLDAKAAYWRGVTRSLDLENQRRHAVRDVAEADLAAAQATGDLGLIMEAARALTRAEQDCVAVVPLRDAVEYIRYDIQADRQTLTLLNGPTHTELETRLMHKRNLLRSIESKLAKK